MTGCAVYKLSLNTEKTEFIVFHATGKKVTEIDIKIKNNAIKRVTKTTFLGVTIHENLKWTFHINNVCSRVASSIGVIRRLSNVFSAKVLRMLYNALVLPIISYANIVWGFGKTCANTNINILQKRAVRTIGNVGYRDHTPPLFKMLDIMPIFDIYNICN